MAVVYDNITNSMSTIDYIPNTYMASNPYVDSNFITTFGPIWLPRIYGKDLTAFEIASSGKIALTINDVHSIDISRSNNTNTIGSYSNTSLELMAGDNDMKLFMDAATNHITMTSLCNVTTNAQYGSIRMNASNNFIVNTLSNLTLNASASNIRLTMDTVSQSMIIYTSNNYYVAASNSAVINGKSNVTITAVNGDIQIAASNSNISIFASNNVNFTASNEFYIRSLSNLALESDAGSVNISSIASNVALYAFDDFVVTTSNDYFLNATSNVTLTSIGGELNITSSNSNINVYALNNINVFSSNNISVISKSNITFTSSNGSVYVSSLTDDISLYSSNDFFLTASNDLTIHTSSNIVLKSANGIIDIRSETSNVSVLAQDDIKITACNDYQININSNISVESKGGNITTFSFGDIILNADNSNVYLNMNVPEDTMYVYALSNINITSCNDLIVGSRSNITFTTSNFNVYTQDVISMTASNIITISSTSNALFSACNTLEISACNLLLTTLNDIEYKAQSNINFYISSAVPSNEPIFSVTGDSLKVRGDIYLTGSINTSNILSTTVVQSTLKVDDKVIVLATGDSNTSDTDGTFTNDKSGIVVNGWPNGDSNWMYTTENKSFLWNYGTTGLPDIGTSNLDKEAFWELQGGSFRLTYQKNYGTSNTPEMRPLSFGFRINEQEELEIVKYFYNSNMSPPGMDIRRVARFGRVIPI
uniref:Uncharacterized protein n=1 Tax=viral metagenome TaxID=1070528 RepID=A0A6C0BEN4_9ZZZZ